MDPTILTHQVMNNLTPVLPYIGSAETGVARKVGETSYQQGKKLYEVIRARFAKEPDDRASRALQAFVDDPGFSSPVEIKLRHLVSADATFADALRQIILTRPRQTLTVKEESQARMLRMTNKTSSGAQEIRGGKRSTIEDVQMNLGTE